MNVMFYLSPQTHIPTNEVYEHGAVCIAEGLTELGIQFYANTNQWFDNERQEYLFKPAPVNFSFSTCIYSTSYFINKLGKLEDIDINKYNVLLDLDDGYPTLSNNTLCNKFNLVLRTHYSTDYKYNKNVKPWAFGISNRIINEINKSKDSQNGNDVYVNYRVGFNVRSMSITEMLPVLAKKYVINHSVTDSVEIKTIDNLNLNDYWNQTGRRHNPAYYKQLNQSLLTLTFCGAFEQKQPHLFYRIKETIEKRTFRISKNFSVANFDRWRFWETLCSVSCPVHLDFNFWNIEFPVMPKQDKDYIGVKNMNFKETAERINSMSVDEIKQIGQNGRNFVLENYAPLPTAKRLLNYIN